MNPEDYPGRGQLPDALAFVPESRTECYLELREADAPLLVADLETRLECSSATVYRMLDDLEAIDVVRKTTVYDPADGPKSGYEAVSAPRARTDGGVRE